MSSSPKLLSKYARLVPVLALSIAAGACSGKGSAQSSVHDLMVVANKPNNLHLVDLTDRKVLRSCELPGKYGSGTVAMAPDKHTAYVISNQFENVYGVNLDTCELTFSAIQSAGNVRVKSIGSLAVSTDGTEVYTHQNPVRLLPDRYEVMDARIAVCKVADGLDAKPVRTFPAPRQVILLIPAADGKTLYLGGQDVFAMNMQTGETTVKIASLHAEDPLQGQRDVLSIWPIGSQSNEFIRLYTAARFTDDTRNMDTARIMWGFERIDLATGEAESRDFGPLEVVLFSGMTRPGDRNQFYAVLTQLKKYDVSQQKELMSVDLDHSYYCLNFSTDGSKVYLAGTFNDIAIHDADTLQKLGNIELPGGDMSLSTAQVFARLP
ncbi:MAG: quinohemoprotein amine dehydrogenase subunit beta [Gammaproteobacteria bacterium]|nr:quinohemoprotein amine dehydrogenase subunit beta [Gammaproteobacteria bacterium]